MAAASIKALNGDISSMVDDESLCLVNHASSLSMFRNHVDDELLLCPVLATCTELHQRTSEDEKLIYCLECTSSLQYTLDG